MKFNVALLLGLSAITQTAIAAPIANLGKRRVEKWYGMPEAWRKLAIILSMGLHGGIDDPLYYNDYFEPGNLEGGAPRYNTIPGDGQAELPENYVEPPQRGSWKA